MRLIIYEISLNTWLKILINIQCFAGKVDLSNNIYGFTLWKVQNCVSIKKKTDKNKDIFL